MLVSGGFPPHLLPSFPGLQIEVYPILYNIILSTATEILKCTFYCTIIINEINKSISTTLLVKTSPLSKLLYEITILSPRRFIYSNTTKYKE